MDHKTFKDKNRQKEIERQEKEKLEKQRQIEKDKLEKEKAILKENDINAKINLYKVLLDSAHESARARKEGLDLYYNHLHLLSSGFQTSIILLSAASTFMQSLSGDQPDSGPIKIIILSITSYSGFILAIGKFLKLDEMRENVHNLRDRFADLQNKIQYYIDYIEPWNNYAHYSNQYKGKDKETEWVSLIEKIETEYVNIIDNKRELSSSYDKIIDSVVSKKYKKMYDKLHGKFKRSLFGCTGKQQQNDDKTKKKLSQNDKIKNDNKDNVKQDIENDIETIVNNP